MAPFIAVLAAVMARKQQQDQARRQAQGNIRESFVGSTGFPTYGIHAATARRQISDMPLDYGSMLGAVGGSGGAAEAAGRAAGGSTFGESEVFDDRFDGGRRRLADAALEDDEFAMHSRYGRRY